MLRALGWGEKEAQNALHMTDGDLAAAIEIVGEPPGVPIITKPVTAAAPPVAMYVILIIMCYCRGRLSKKAKCCFFSPARARVCLWWACLFVMCLGARAHFRPGSSCEKLVHLCKVVLNSLMWITPRKSIYPLFTQTGPLF